ncbi:MAG: ATP synthase subunit I [Cyanobacteria bacterium J06638_38]
MSQAKSGWQEIFKIWILLSKDRRLRCISGQIFGLLMIVLLWWLNWKLFLATTAGIGLMSCCYLMQNPHWQRYWRKCQGLLVGSNRQLAVAVGTGASGAFCTYLAASVWTDAENQWLATGSILQGVVSLTTLALLWWSLRGKKARSLEAKLDQLLADLSHGDRLKRLIAIRQLTRLLIKNRLSAEHYCQSVEYYRLMLGEPQAPMVRNALLESLAILEGDNGAKQPSEIKIPLQLQRSRKLASETFLRDSIKEQR